MEWGSKHVKGNFVEEKMGIKTIVFMYKSTYHTRDNAVYRCRTNESNRDQSFECNDIVPSLSEASSEAYGLAG